ncbi:hypothetical protein DPMN_121792 [Dreissena polymorpha]|uniref:Uncharacterized protein n=1 Tax=Dreissena polymorpha TaxID=45954 RepID=A0A9D4GQQ7_DREPO|nr:hypothetical protein DPMN_121792 [Dreissena polymorpha]
MYCLVDVTLILYPPPSHDTRRNSQHVFRVSGEGLADTEKKILDEEEAKIPSDFSDATTEDDIDLSKLTPAQRRQYLAEKERRRKEREERRREKYGDKYDEIMKKKNR